MDLFSPNAQKVLLGLIEHPRLSDKELAAELGLNRSTLATTKSALGKARVYRTIMLPDFAKLGFELLMVATASLATTIDFSTRKDSWSGVHGTHDHFFTLSDVEKLLTMAYGPNLTLLQQRIDLFEYLYTKGKFLDTGSLNFTFFPLTLSVLHSNLDWPNLLRRKFNLPRPPNPPTPLSSPTPVKLNPRQSAVLMALVAEPEAPMTRIAGLAGVSRLTATKIKEELLASELLKQIRVVSPRALGFTLWVYLRVPFSSASTIKTRHDATSNVLFHTPLVYFEKKQEAVGIFLFSSLESYHATLNALIRAYESGGHLAAKPISHIFLLNQIKFARTYNYHGNLQIGAETATKPHG